MAAEVVSNLRVNPAVFKVQVSKRWPGLMPTESEVEM